MKDYINKFIDYLFLEKGLSKNTIDGYKNDLEDLYIFITKKNKSQTLQRIDKTTILEYYRQLEKKEFSKSTLQRKYSSINQFFKFLVKKKYINENPMLSMHRQKKEIKLPKFLTEQEINSMLSVNSNFKNTTQMRNQLILEMLYSTGMRVSELCSLQLSSLNINKNNNDNYFFLTIKGKGKKERIVPIRKNVLQLLEDYIKITKKNKQKYLFQSNGKNNFITRRTILNIIKQTATLAGLDFTKISPQTIRHSFATHLLQKGLDIREIQELLGHSSIDTTSIYAKINDRNSKEIIENFHPLAKNNK